MLKILGEKIAERAKKISLPFFDGVPLYDVALFFWRSIVDGSITTRASAIAFSFFIAFFPFIIFLFTLIPYIPIENFQKELLILIQDVVPERTYPAIESTVEDIITQPRGDLLSIGFFTALIFSTNGLAAMMSAFDATIHTYTSKIVVKPAVCGYFYSYNSFGIAYHCCCFINRWADIGSKSSGKRHFTCKLYRSI